MFVSLAASLPAAESHKPAPAHPLQQWSRGTPVTLPLPDGTVRAGKVELVRHDDDGWTRAGGALADGGSFSFGTNGILTGGLVQLPRENIAWQLRPQADGGTQYVRRALDEIRCSFLPRPFPEYEDALPAETELKATPPILSSRPGANAVLFLDFDGEVVQDPNWAEGQTIDAPRARFSAKQITLVHERVAGDYAAFNVDITTNPARYASASVGNRMRCIITRNDKAAPRSGGVAYVSSFADAGTSGLTNNIPCWVFIDRNVDACAEAISHELGHTLGLNHDGRDLPNGRHQEYYPGQGRGSTGWAPIMGVSYYKRLSQWSKGEYKNPSNTEDDIAIITGNANGFGFVSDDVGDTPNASESLDSSGPIVEQHGRIEKASDVDVFKFMTTGGRAAIRATADGREGNVDILIELLDSGGSVLTNSNPGKSLNAQLRKNLAAGTYYLRISGVGKGDPLKTGYTDYGCIGLYKIVGKIKGLGAAPFIATAE
jgi:hypothetical protein